MYNTKKTDRNTHTHKHRRDMENMYITYNKVIERNRRSYQNLQHSLVITNLSTYVFEKNDSERNPQRSFDLG